jgi:flagellar protein FlaG
VDKETRRTIIKIIDPQTKEVIRQIPPEEALRISRMISRIVRDRGAVTDERV